MIASSNDPEDGKAIVLTAELCGVQGCCPTVKIHSGEDKVTITDDFGGSVLLTKEQLRILRSDPRLEP